MLNKINSKLLAELREHLMQQVRDEYTVMPRFGFHQPLDYLKVTLPPSFAPPENDSSSLAVPGRGDRFGYSEDDSKEYLEWGKHDHDLLMEVIEKHFGAIKSANILDLGCSSGRVLRHFDSERVSLGWQLYGCDIQARAIEWMRRNFPAHFNVITNSTLPHLPYEDATFDVIYGISVFTHIKFQWDAWLMELRRVMKPGALLMQTIHAENAWKFYHEHRNEGWVRENHCARVYDSPSMDLDYLYYGDACVSQVFWKKEIAIDFWGRYFNIVELCDPPERSFQDWIICKKEIKK